MTAEAPFDVGLQPERTLLAWRRTALSLGLACAIGIRLTVESLWPAPVIIGVVGIALSAAAYVGASRRYRRAHRSLVDAGELGSGGRSVTAVAAVAVLLAALALVAVLTGGIW